MANTALQFYPLHSIITLLFFFFLQKLSYQYAEDPEYSTLHLFHKFWCLKQAGFEFLLYL